MEEFSNTDDDVFLVRTKRMIDRGALLSRYSRTASLDIRDLYAREFANNEKRGTEFYKKVFIEYGDESVSELVTAQMAIQNVSNIVSKKIEEIRVGLSFLEKSSRYVRYDKKVNGRFLFADPGKIGLSGKAADEYSGLCTSLFETYSELYEPMLHSLKKMYPIEEMDFMSSDEGKYIPYGNLSEQDMAIAKKSYDSSVRSRGLDDLRFLLPASTLTNIGISGNGRSYIELIKKLKYSGDTEAEILAEKIYRELLNEFPGLIENAVTQRSQDIANYETEVVKATMLEIQGKIPAPTVSLVSGDDRNAALDRVITLLFYHNGPSISTIGNRVASMSIADKKNLISRVAQLRTNRKMKPPRAFEAVNYLFEVNTNYGAFRDLQRHRFLSIIRSQLSTAYGYDIPEVIGQIEEYRNKFVNAMEKAKRAYSLIKEKHGSNIAQYVVPYAFRYPVTVGVNLREVTYFIELRSTPQAHYDLRNISAEMFKCIKTVHPELSEIIRFADTGHYELGRIMAEQRKERKLLGSGNSS
ncbi:MAG: hypothetical protein B2I17_00220 [Thermoplasmatales archaeon B_DKE]|nr:MAG: hypothetical protein B2I17_00220 [Thermoplasmatales archaeon B_DKE]